MSRKLDADQKEQAKRLSVLSDANGVSSHVDEPLTGNQTILHISQKQLNIAQDGNVDQGFYWQAASGREGPGGEEEGLGGCIRGGERDRRVGREGANRSFRGAEERRREARG